MDEIKSVEDLMALYDKPRPSLMLYEADLKPTEVYVKELLDKLGIDPVEWDRKYGGQEE